ncbi:putative plasma membrane zinc ion transporter [Melanomma pulvis-pyrius CBS 109.77]|uniref:Putative plasma membrane zinc ion transporter n=1 Tax=Melanomma pulvis-pyrius CBS 109.77 TaxID=1314802 RepID=A0A6A6XMG1_9PLEO|nr:putative plasma membrane zinc ion transporter [Melanomma pulvis-pyrius CBS 109.77]
MNCPSRTDDDGFNPGWNQNPPLFASALTTCQDMNGIANSRELRNVYCTIDGKSCLGCDGAHGSSINTRPPECTPVRTKMGARSPSKGPCTRLKESSNAGITDQICPLNTSCRSSTPDLISWILWLLSVLCTSILISSVGRNVFRASTRFDKRASCTTGGASENYNVPFHVGGLFIILFVSTTACAFPILVIKFPRLRIPASFLFSAKHFGTGVLIATAFVHLLPTAFISLGNPCLSGFWTTDYPAMPGAIALAGIFFVAIVEMIFSPTQHACGGGNQGVDSITQTPHHHENNESDRPGRVQPVTIDGSTQMRNLGPLQGRASSISRTLSRMDQENQRLDDAEAGAQRAQDAALKIERRFPIGDSETSQQISGLTPEQAHKKAVMQCFLLEMGILFHSVFIGMSLSVSVGSEFVVLLIAIIFHQTFEGLALGVRIAAIEWPKNGMQPWLMALAYGCTTPLGQAIGIATHTLYAPDSEIGLLMVGVMNAISAGLLVFASLVELLSEDFLSDKSWQILEGKRRVYACVLVFLGAFFMSLVGAWA